MDTSHDHSHTVASKRKRKWKYEVKNLCKRCSRGGTPGVWSYGFPAKSLWSSPLDRFGFFVTCCWCVPLRMATAFICFLTFIWAAFELRTAEKFLKNVIENKEMLYYAKMAYFAMTVGLMVVAGILLLGIIMKKYLFVNVYIWYVLVFSFLSILLYVIVITLTVTKSGNLPRRMAFKMAVTIAWYAVYFYFLLVVNSYKSNLW